MLGIVLFNYNGSERKVTVQKETETYIQGENLHADADRRFSTYSKAKMTRFCRLSGKPFITPKKIDEICEEIIFMHLNLEKSLSQMER
jgi:hypothetical protein